MSLIVRSGTVVSASCSVVAAESNDEPKGHSAPGELTVEELGSALLRLVELEKERDELLSMLDDAEIVSVRLSLSGQRPVAYK